MANIDVLHFGIDKVTTILEWVQESGAFYNISIVPQVMTLRIIRSTSVQLTVSYNIQYNVSIVAFDSLCGQNSAITALELNFGESHLIHKVYV